MTYAYSSTTFVALKLTDDEDGHDIWINLHKIVALRPATWEADKTSEVYVGTANPFIVRESVAVIIAAINESNGAS